MKFAELAWGAYVWGNLNRDTYGYERYETLASDAEFLGRLPSEPSLNDFKRLRDFLVHFGVHYAPKDLAQQYMSVWPQLKPYVQRLVGETLEKCDFQNSEICTCIQSVFGCLQWPTVWGGDTVALKVIHFFNPQFFVMWDSDIQAFYGGFREEGYVRFLARMQEHARQVLQDFVALRLPGSPQEFLSKQLGYGGSRTLAKFIDDFNWVTLTKGWPSALPEWLWGLLRRHDTSAQGRG